MSKKAKAQFGSAQVDQVKDLAQSVMDSSHRIWLAGLGAFSKAQQEGMKVFDRLVKEGEALEAQTRKVASTTAEAATDAARAKAKEMQAMAGGTWDKLEQVFEERVARSLHRLGVYRSSDFQVLSERVAALAEAVGDLLQKPVRGAGAVATKPARARRASKPASARTPKPAGAKSAKPAAPKASRRAATKATRARQPKAA